MKNMTLILIWMLVSFKIYHQWRTPLNAPPRIHWSPNILPESSRTPFFDSWPSSKKASSSTVKSQRRSWKRKKDMISCMSTTNGGQPMCRLLSRWTKCCDLSQRRWIRFMTFFSLDSPWFLPLVSIASSLASGSERSSHRASRTWSKRSSEYFPSFNQTVLSMARTSEARRSRSRRSSATPRAISPDCPTDPTLCSTPLAATTWLLTVWSRTGLPISPLMVWRTLACRPPFLLSPGLTLAMARGPW